MRPYPRYKDSEVKWIGEIPDTWKMPTVGKICKLGRGRVISNIEISENSGKYPVYSSQTSNNGILGYLSSYDFKGEYITWTTDGANAGRVFFRSGEFNCTNVCGTMIPMREDVFLPYFSYLLNILTPYYVRLDINPKLMNDMMSPIRICFPTFPEQKQIAKYLDHKTAKIDSLIEKKKRLIELLKEERTAVINQAVTKGLDPDAPMKDSGIELLGEIPEHWELKRLKFEAYVNREALPETTEPEYRIEYIDIGNVILGKLIDSPKLMPFKEAPSRARRIVKKGDTILSTVRTYLRAITFIDVDKDNLIASTGFAVITSRENLDSKYMSCLMTCEKIIDTICSLSTGVSYPAVTSTTVENLIIWYPPIDEQKRIVFYIEKETTRIDSIISKSEKEIELLQEYRTALISEAVTGKIDVREEDI